MSEKLSVERHLQIERAIAEAIRVSIRTQGQNFLGAARAALATIDDAGLKVILK